MSSNRRALLDAANELIAESGVATLTMDSVARRALVGKGTVYRRFGSRAGLMLALLDRAELEFQSAVLFGPEPLGPGGAAVDRLVAFGRARMDYVVQHGDLLSAAGAETFRDGAYWALVTHVRVLIKEVGVAADELLLAQLLLAGLDVRLVLQQVREQGIPLQQITDQWESAVRAVLAPGHRSLAA